MNIFRLIGDLLHLISFLILIWKIKKTKSVTGKLFTLILIIFKGLSMKSQLVFLIVFCTRYIDLFLYWISLYNFCMKILYISATLYILYLFKMKHPISLTYDSVLDSINLYKFIFPPAAALTIVFHTGFTPFELLWSFSIWLEALAIIP